MWLSSMMPTLTLLGSSGRFMARSSGTMTRLSRSACSPETGLALAVGDDDGAGRVVSFDDEGEAEPPLLLVTPAQPPSSRASARPTPSPLALRDIMLRCIGLLLGLRQRLEEELAAAIAARVAQHAVTEEVDVLVDGARVIGLVQLVAGFRRGPGEGPRSDCVSGCRVSHWDSSCVLTSCCASPR